MDQELVSTFQQVANQLASMNHDDFIAMLDAHEEGGISYFLQDSGINFWDTFPVTVNVPVTDTGLDSQSIGYSGQSYVVYGQGVAQVSSTKLHEGWDVECQYSIAA